jgi:hypothetical protein
MAATFETTGGTATRPCNIIVDVTTGSTTDEVKQPTPAAGPNAMTPELFQSGGPEMPDTDGASCAQRYHSYDPAQVRSLDIMASDPPAVKAASNAANAETGR